MRSKGDCRVFRGRIAQWKVRNMQPPRLESDPGRAIRTLPPSVALVAALTYNLHFDSCAAYLQDILDAGWLSDALDQLSDEVLETCLLLAESGAPVIHELWYKLAGRVPRKYARAFERVLQSPPIDLDLETALVDLGFSEILESVDRLKTKEEIAYYLELLSPAQFKDLQRALGVELSRSAIVAWTAPHPIESRTVNGSSECSDINLVPIDPPRFRNAQSMVEWHRDFLISTGSPAHWRPADPEQLMQLWDAPGPAQAVKLNAPNRVLILSDSPEAVHGSAFFNHFEGALVRSTEAARRLKAKAQKIASITPTLRAVSVIFRQQEHLDDLALCARLEPLDVLADASAYLLDAGADVSVVDPALAAASRVSGYDAVVWPAHLLNGAASRIGVMQVLAGNGFERWGRLAEPLDLPEGVSGPDKALVAVMGALRN